MSPIAKHDTSLEGTSILTVRTDGVWRASQVSDALLTFDLLTARIGVALHIAETCDKYDYVLSNMEVFGLFEKKTTPLNYPSDPLDASSRSDFMNLLSKLRVIGVQPIKTDIGLTFSFVAADLAEIAPLSSRLEVQKIRMASPGVWSLLLSGLLGSRSTTGILHKLFDALFYPRSARRQRTAEARSAIAKARAEEATARQKEARAQLETASTKYLLKRINASSNVLLDHTVPLDSIRASLNGRFPSHEINKALASITDPLERLTLYHSSGLIKSITIADREPTPRAQRKRPTKPRM